MFTALATQGYTLLGEALETAAPLGFAEVGAAYVLFAVSHPGHFAVMHAPDLVHADDPRARRRVDPDQPRSCSTASPPSPPARRDQVAVKAAAAWALVHGLATLALSGALAHDHLVGGGLGDLHQLVLRATSLLDLTRTARSMTPSGSDRVTEHASPDRLDLGPRAGRGHAVGRRLGRAVLAGIGTSVVLLVLTLVTARGWRPPPTLAPLDVAPVPSVAVPDRHLPYAFVDRVDTSVAGGLRPGSSARAGPRARSPAVVLVAGAGATTRDDLADEAEALARGGLVVLTYDKRRAGYPVLRRDYERLADDALAALDVVARQPAVDPERVGLLGFSEGGWVVPLAAERAATRAWRSRCWSRPPW